MITQQVRGILSALPRPQQVLRLLCAVILLLVLVRSVDVSAAVQYVMQAQWHWLLAGLVLVQVQLVLSAWRWKLIVERLGHPMALPHAITEYYLATAINLSLPGGVGGDAARVYRHRQAQGLERAVHGVVLERMAGQVALLVLALSGWVLWLLVMDRPIIVLKSQVLMVLFALGVVLLVFSLFLRRQQWAWVNHFRRLLHALRVSCWQDRQWFVQGLLNGAVVLTYILVFACAACAIQACLPVFALFTLVPLVLLSMLIPLSIGGWGVRETAAALLWPVAAMTAEAGVASSVVYALISLIGCLPGLAVLIVRRGQMSA